MDGLEDKEDPILKAYRQTQQELKADSIQKKNEQKELKKIAFSVSIGKRKKPDGQGEEISHLPHRAQHILKSEKILFLNHATDTVIKG